MKTRDEILEELISSIETNTDLSNLENESSVAGIILRALAAGLEPVYTEIENARQLMDPSSASGSMLDIIGAMYGMSRSSASVATSMNGVTFTTVSGNGWSGDSVTIPAGTLVWSSQYPSIKYKTTTSVTFVSGTVSGMTGLTATVSGSGANAVAGKIDSFQHAKSGSIKVTNPYSIDTGLDNESDYSFRIRILQRIRANYNQGLNEISEMLYSIPGVDAVVLYPYRRGAGTVDALIMASTGSPSPDFIAIVENNISYMNLPLSLRVITPSEKRLSLEISLQTTSSYDKTNILSIARNTIIQTVNSTGLGASLNLPGLVSNLSMLSGVTSARIIGASIDNNVFPVSGTVLAAEDETIRTSAAEVFIH